MTVFAWSSYLDDPTTEFTHSETGTPYPYWIVLPRSVVQEQAVIRTIVEMFGCQTDLSSYSGKLHHGNHVVMFRDMSDRTLLEISLPAGIKVAKVNPEKRTT